MPRIDPTPEEQQTARAIARKITSGYYGQSPKLTNVAAFVEEEVASALASARARDQQRVGELTEALRAHGKHPASCEKGVGIGIYEPRPDAVCNCGIDAALKGSR